MGEIWAQERREMPEIHARERREMQDKIMLERDKLQAGVLTGTPNQQSSFCKNFFDRIKVFPLLVKMMYQDFSVHLRKQPWVWSGLGKNGQ